MLKQRSIKNTVSIRGIGLHSGENTEIVFKYADIDSGIVFHRTDISPKSILPAYAMYVENTYLATILQYNNIKISTVEHLMSALCGLGIDNLNIYINSEEVPIMDGSSLSFVNLLLSSGIIEQNAYKKFIKILEPVEVFEGYGESRKYARLEPYNGFAIKFSINYNHPVISSTPNSIEIDFSKDSYIESISGARTFGFIQDIEKLRSKGLIKGASIDNAIVIDDYRIINPGGLRYKDEFIRHKVLDAIGDLYLLGYPLMARYVASKSGHYLNNKLVRTLLEKENSWDLVSCDYISN